MPSMPHNSPPAPVTLADLRRLYGADWEITERPAGMLVVTAEHRSGDGRSVRYLVAHSVAELAAKLETAGTVEP
jgi:hypothetical protein